MGLDLNRKLAGRLIGEFVVIVLGVLVALGVDDWNQERSDRELEINLLDRMQSELLADGADLASADVDARARDWVLDAVLAELGDEDAAARLKPQRLDSLRHPTRRDSLRAAAGRGASPPFDLVARPLRIFRYRPEFDLSSDAYQEMITTGTLGIVRDNEVRSTIMFYYRWARDQADNERQDAGYRVRLEDALASIGVAPGDDLTLAELASRAQGSPTFAVEVRRAQNSIRMQSEYYSRIETVRRELEDVLKSKRASR